MSGKGTMKNFKTMLAEAKLPERTVEICLRGDLVAEHEDAERELEQAERKQADSLAGGGTGEIVERIEALEAQMREHVAVFTVRALPRPAWRALLADHPPRRDDQNEIVEEDRGLEIDVSTFYDDLIRRSVVDPEMDADDWATLADVLTDRQFGDLAGAAWLLNRGEVDVPFSRAASRAKRATAAE
jgi:hypothetical protein